jgi:toxin ParE1/3/4
MEKVSWSSEAEVDLAEIGDYIASENPEAAWRIISDIVEHTEMLANFPKMRPIYCVENSLEIRESLCGKYRIFYTIRNGTEVHILKIWQGARDEPDFTGV